MLVILCRWTDRGEDYYNTEDTRKQLFGLLYKLPKLDNSKEQPERLLPIFCQKLGEPINRDNYRSLDYIYYGNAVRSNNVKVAAVVTALPLGNEDNVDEEEPRETAVVLLYDININMDSIEKRHEIEVPRRAYTSLSYLTMAMINGGELISISTTQDQEEGGFWGV
jgi:hypothetical protein